MVERVSACAVRRLRSRTRSTRRVGGLAARGPQAAPWSSVALLRPWQPGARSEPPSRSAWKATSHGPGCFRRTSRTACKPMPVRRTPRTMKNALRTRIGWSSAVQRQSHRSVLLPDQVSRPARVIDGRLQPLAAKGSVGVRHDAAELGQVMADISHDRSNTVSSAGTTGRTDTSGCDTATPYDVEPTLHAADCGTRSRPVQAVP